jgi:hypothetical protein
MGMTKLSGKLKPEPSLAWRDERPNMLILPDIIPELYSPSQRRYALMLNAAQQTYANDGG